MPVNPSDKHVGELVAFKLTERDRLPWLAADGRRIPISEMDDDYIRNTINMVRRWYKGGTVFRNGSAIRQSPVLAPTSPYAGREIAEWVKVFEREVKYRALEKRQRVSSGDYGAADGSQAPR